MKITNYGWSTNPTALRLGIGKYSN
jgi:hypothetical protein